MSLCLSSGFSVHSFRVQDCNMYSYCIAQLGLIVSLVSTNYLVEFIAERKSPGFTDFYFFFKICFCNQYINVLQGQSAILIVYLYKD